MTLSVIHREGHCPIDGCFWAGKIYITSRTTGRIAQNTKKGVVLSNKEKRARYPVMGGESVKEETKVLDLMGGAVKVTYFNATLRSDGEVTINGNGQKNSLVRAIGKKGPGEWFFWKENGQEFQAYVRGRENIKLPIGASP